MHESMKQGIELAAEISKQLIALSTGIVALTITFMKDIVRHVDRAARRLLLSSWCGYLLTVLFALWHLSALTGNLLSKTPPADVESAVLPAYLQMIAFFAATCLIIAVAFRDLLRSGR